MRRTLLIFVASVLSTVAHSSNNCTTDIVPFYFVEKTQVGEVVGTGSKQSEHAAVANLLQYNTDFWRNWSYRKSELSFNQVSAEIYSSTIKIYKVATGKWGYVDLRGEVVVAPQYEIAQPFCNGLAGVKLDGKWGYINKTGELVVAAKYSNATRFSEGVAAVVENTKWNFIDKRGALVCPMGFARLGVISKGVAAAGVFDPEDEILYGFVNKECHFIVEPKYENAFFHNGIGAVKQKERWRFVTDKGKDISESTYDDARPLVENLWRVTEGGRFGLLAPLTATAPTWVEKHRQPSENLVAAQVAGKGVWGEWGYVDAITGTWAIKPIYLDALPFSFGVAPVAVGYNSGNGATYTTYGFMDRQQKWIISPVLPTDFNPSHRFFVEVVSGFSMQTDGRVLARIKSFSGRDPYWIDLKGNYADAPPEKL